MAEKYLKKKNKRNANRTRGMAFPRKSGFVSRVPMNNEKKKLKTRKKRGSTGESKEQYFCYRGACDICVYTCFFYLEKRRVSITIIEILH